MYIIYMAGRPPRQKAKNDARQLCLLSIVTKGGRRQRETAKVKSYTALPEITKR